MRRRLPVLGVLAGLGAAGCTQNVHVLSDPPGARVVVNRNYIGDTPCQTTFDLDMSSTLRRSYEVVVYPPSGSEEIPAQYRYLSRWDDPPERMFFYFKPRQPVEEPQADAPQP
jgi:hypothetical protein